MKRTKSSISMPYPELRGTINQIRYPAWAEIKLDGEFNHLIRANGQETKLINKHGLIRTDCPITRKVDKLFNGPVHMIGELHYGEGKQHDLYNLLKNQGSDSLNFTAFDIVELEGVDMRGQTLLTRLGKLSHFRAPLGQIVRDRSEAQICFQKTIDTGYEGIVLKNLDERLVLGPCGWFKWKMKDQTDLEITMIDQVKERMEVAVFHIDKGVRRVKQCGVKIMNADKKLLKVGDLVTIEHQGILSGGGLRHPVFISKKERE